MVILMIILFFVIILAWTGDIKMITAVIYAALFLIFGPVIAKRDSLKRNHKEAITNADKYEVAKGLVNAIKENKKLVNEELISSVQESNAANIKNIISDSNPIIRSRSDGS